MLATYGDDAYQVVLTLHILCAIVGFGSVFFDTLYFRAARSRRGAEGLAISEANDAVSKVGEYFVLAVLVLGIGLVFMGDEVVDFGQTWIWLSIVVYVGAILLKKYLLWPRLQRHVALEREIVAGGPPGDATGTSRDAELATLGRQLGILGWAPNLLMVVILALMVFQPGGA